MYPVWNHEDYGFMLTSFSLRHPYKKGDIFIIAETIGWLDPNRQPVVRFHRYTSESWCYLDLPTFTLDETDPEPLCNAESLNEDQIEWCKKWITDNYVSLQDHWIGKTDSMGLINGLNIG